SVSLVLDATGSVGETESSPDCAPEAAARASADSSRLHVAHPATWASSADLREATIHPRTNAAMSSSAGQVSSSNTCAIVLSPSTAAKRAHDQVAIDSDPAQGAIELAEASLVERGGRSRGAMRACTGEVEIRRVHPAQCDRRRRVRWQSLAQIR